MLAAANGVGGEAELEEAPLAEQTLAVGRGESLAVCGAAEDRVEARSRGRPLRLVEARRGAREQARIRGLGPEALEADHLLVAEVVADRFREVCTE